MREITGVPERSQRRYDQQAGVVRRTNIAIGARFNERSQEATAAAQGNASFQFYDHDGGQGRPGGDYMAWQLPNSYDGPHKQGKGLWRPFFLFPHAGSLERLSASASATVTRPGRL